MDIVVATSDELDADRRRELRALWDRAFGTERFSDEDADHAYGGLHVMALDRDRVVAHASAIPRQIRFGTDPWRTVGYVEAVATEPERQGEGIGRRVMLRLHDEMATRWPAAMLSTGRATGFYEKLGWERWAGLSYTQTGPDTVPDEEHGGLMILRIDPSAVPDLTVDVTCQDRPGDAW